MDDVDALFAQPTSLHKLHQLDALCKRDPLHVGRLRRLVSADIIPYVRAMAPKHAARAALLDVLQHWLEIGLVRTPVALPGTGFFAALRARAAAAAAQSDPSDGGCGGAPRARAELYLPADPRTCAVCSSACAVGFDDDLNAWVYADAVKLNDGNVVHRVCADDDDDADA